MRLEVRKLRHGDDRKRLRTGNHRLDHYFRRYAGMNQFEYRTGVSYVAAEGDRLVGFMTVSPVSVQPSEIPTGGDTQPHELPVLRVARLGVDRRYQRKGIGKRLLLHAIQLAEEMADRIGCSGLLVDAKPEAVEFYAGYGFQRIVVEEGKLPSGEDGATTEMFLHMDTVHAMRAGRCVVRGENEE